jgi:hypothetical protein
MKTIVLFVIAIFTFGSSNGQITKNNWLVGGTGFFQSTDYTVEGLKYQKMTNLQLAPNVGCFILDKFAAGLKLSFSTTRYKNTVEGAGFNLTKQTSFGAGPFLRYYLLNAEKQFNLLIDGSYEYNIERSGGVASTGNTPLPVPITQYSKNTFAIAAGPVLYFNTSVGLEFLIGYSITKFTQKKQINNNGVQIGLGLQVHLENDK